MLLTRPDSESFKVKASRLDRATPDSREAFDVINHSFDVLRNAGLVDVSTGPREIREIKPTTP